MIHWTKYFVISGQSYKYNIDIMSVESGVVCSTPTGKRLAAEMSFSPEMANLDSLSELLDKELQPLHEKVDKVIGISKDVTKLQNEIKFLKAENKELRDKVDKLENYSQRNNIRLYNIRERMNENLDEFLVHMINKYLSLSDRWFTDSSFKNVHRLGKSERDQTWVVIARFNSFKEKQHLLKIKQQIKQLKKNKISCSLYVKPSQFEIKKKLEV